MAVRRSSLLIALGMLATTAALGVLHYKPWQRAEGKSLAVGFLPVTCHLTCPVTDFASHIPDNVAQGIQFTSKRFADFPTVVEALKSGSMQATFLLAPLAMVLREQHVPVKIVYLGHRDGSTIMVAKASTARSLRDLKGKTFAIPSRFSNQNLVVRKLMDDQGLAENDIKFVEMPPPDMPGALAAGVIDAYFVGEPFAAKAELDGTGRVLYFAKDIWPHFISCVLVVTEKLIHEHPEQVEALVRGIAESGMWAEHHREEAAKLAAPYYAQDEKLLHYVLTEPPDRVSYEMLTPTDEELGAIMNYAIKAKLLKGPIELSELIDRRFIPEHIRAVSMVPPIKEP